MLLLDLHLGAWRQQVQNPFCIGGSAFYHVEQALEAGMGRIAQALVHPALAGGDDNAGLRAQAIQGDGDLATVAAADGVGQHVDGVAAVAHVQGGLGDADVRLDAHEGEGGGRRRQLGPDALDGHAEARLVDGRRGQQRGQRRHRRAQLGGGLRGRVHRDGEVGGEGEELLRGGYAVGSGRDWESADGQDRFVAGLDLHAVELVDGVAELVLHVADTTLRNNPWSASPLCDRSKFDWGHLFVLTESPGSLQKAQSSAARGSTPPERGRTGFQQTYSGAAPWAVHRRSPLCGLSGSSSAGHGRGEGRGTLLARKRLAVRGGGAAREADADADEGRRRWL